LNKAGRYYTRLGWWLRLVRSVIYFTEGKGFVLFRLLPAEGDHKGLGGAGPGEGGEEPATGGS
jgi:hypothetical protein